MANTTFSGPIRSGTVREGASANLGKAVLQQTGTLAFDATLVQNLTFYVPPNSRIVDVLVDVITAYDSATSATLTAGTASAGTEYVSGVNAKTAARTRPTFSAAQLGNMNSVGSNTSVVFTVTSVGQPTAGSTRITLLYVQN